MNTANGTYSSTAGVGSNIYNFVPGTYFSSPTMDAGGFGAAGARAATPVAPVEYYGANIDYSGFVDPNAGMGEFRKGLNRGWEQTQALGYGSVGLLGDILGLDEVRDWGFEGYQRNMEEAAHYQAATPGFTDIDSVGSALDWVAGTAGELIPTAASTIATAGGASILARTVGSKLLRRYAAKEIAQKTAELSAAGFAQDQAKALATKEALANLSRKVGTASMIGFSAGQEAGANWGQDVENHGKANTSPGLDLMFGLASGMSEAIWGADASLWRAVTGRAVKPSVERAFRRELINGLPKAMISEGSQEAFQEILSKINANIQDSKDLVTVDDIEDIFNAAMAGSLGGAGFHMPTLLASRRQRKQDNTKAFEQNASTGVDSITRTTNPLNDPADTRRMQQDLVEARNPWMVARKQEQDYLRGWDEYANEERAKFEQSWNSANAKLLSSFAAIQDKLPRLNELPPNERKNINRILAQHQKYTQEKQKALDALNKRLDKGYTAADGTLITAAKRQVMLDNKRRYEQINAVPALNRVLEDATVYAQKVGNAIDKRITTITSAINELTARMESDQRSLSLTADKYRRYQAELKKLTNMRAASLRSKRNVVKAISKITKKASNITQDELGSVGLDVQELYHVGDSALELSRTNDIFREGQATRLEDVNDRFEQLKEQVQKAQKRVDALSDEKYGDRKKAVQDVLRNTAISLSGTDLYRDMPLRNFEGPTDTDPTANAREQQEREATDRATIRSGFDSLKNEVLREQQVLAQQQDIAARNEVIRDNTGQQNVQADPQDTQIKPQEPRGGTENENPTQPLGQQEIEPQKVTSAIESDVAIERERENNQSVATAVRSLDNMSKQRIIRLTEWLSNTMKSLPVLRDKVVLCLNGSDAVLPIEVRNSLQNVQGAVRGVYWNDRIYLFTDNIMNKQDAVRTLIHEGVVHYGLRSIMTNEQLGKFLDLTYHNFANTKEWSDFQSRRPEYFKNGDRVTQAEEFVAYLAEQMKLSRMLGPSTKSLFTRVVSFLRNLLASIGLFENVTSKDIRDVISLSAQNLARKRGDADYIASTIKGLEVLIGDTVPLQDSVMFQTAFHGTPHKFDQFTLDHIGSGEGAQAHGWGLYFAQNREVSEGYRDRLADKNTVVQLGENQYTAIYTGTIRPDWVAADGQKVTPYSPLELALSALYETGNVADAVAYLEDIQSDLESIDDLYETDRRKLSNIPRALLYLEDSKIDFVKSGSLFEVDIPENDVLLDEDLPISSQPEKVKEVVNKLIDLYELPVTEADSGGKFYRKYSQEMLSPEDASRDLNDRGIKGITYDGMLDGRCFVVFDDKAIKILNKLEDVVNNPEIRYAFQERQVNEDPVYGMRFLSAEASQPYYRNLEGTRSGNTNTPYIVNLPKNSNTLNLNDVITSQSNQVQSRLKKLIDTLGVDINPKTTSGWSLYNILSEALGSKRKATEILRDFGVRGAQYAENGNNNFYLFEGNNLSDKPYQYNTDVLSEPKFLVTKETPADEITTDLVTGDLTTKDTADELSYMNALYSEVESQSKGLNRLRDVLKTGKTRDKDGNIIEHSLWEKVIEGSVDQYRRLYTVQNYLKKKFPGIINGVTNVYQQLQGMINRIRQAQCNYRNEFFRPAIEALQSIDAPIPVYDKDGNIVRTYKKGDALYEDFLLKMFDDVLVARHAAERNKSVSDRMRGHRYPIKDEDGNVVGTGHTNRKKPSEKDTIINASGMSDAQAARILERYGNFPGLDKAIAHVDRMNKFTLNTMLSNNLITQEAYDRMSKYDFYVPLIGWQEMGEQMFPAYFRSGGRSMSTGGKPVVRTAKGRSGLPESPFLRSVKQMDDILAIAERNELMRNFGELVKSVNNTEDKNTLFEFDNKNPEAVRLQVLKDGTIGFVTKTTEFQGSGEGAVTYIDNDGSAKRIVIHDKWLAAAMRGENRAPISAYVNTLRKYTGIMTQYMTARNPAFAIVNPIRDLPSAIINIGSSIEENIQRGLLEKTEDIQKGVVKDVVSGKLMKLVWDISKYDTLGTKFDTSKYDAGLVSDLNDWRTYGGHTRMIDEMTVKDMAKSVRKELKEKGPIKSVANKLIDYMDVLSDTTENTTRFAVYRNFMKAFRENLNKRAKEEGWSDARYAEELDIAKQKSVNIALECTVNFTRKGAWANAYNPLWAFSSASLQSFARICRNLWRPTSTPQQNFKRVSKFLATGMAFPLMWGTVARAIMGDDDDGINRYDKIPDYVKYGNLIIPMPFSDGGYVKIPLPYGYNVFTAAGTIFDDVIHGNTSATKGSMSLLKIAMNGVSPIDPSEQGILAFVPTLFKPVVEVAANVNFAGAPIMPSGPGTDSLADHMKSWASTPQAYKDAAALINFISGGWITKDGIGAVDISPETIEHITMSYSGGIGRIFQQMITLATSPAFGHEVGVKDVPVLNRLYGTTTYQNNNALYNRYNDQVNVAKALMREAEGNPERTRELRDNFRSALSLEKKAQSATTELNKIKQAERALRKRYPQGTKSRAFNAQMELIQKRKERVMKRFNASAHRAGLTMD